MAFYFLGTSPLSKSLLLRALVVKSFFPEFQIRGTSSAQDVQYMQAGLKKGLVDSTKNIIDCGEGGAVLRFLATRLSREQGTFTLTGTPYLLKRGGDELPALLQQLGAEVTRHPNALCIKSAGWQLSGDSLVVSDHRTSQLASAVLLSSWNFHRDIFLKIEGDRRSFSYFQMTLDFLRSLGMQVMGDDSSREYHIPARQHITKLKYQPEPDMSCLFALAAMTVGGGQALFQKWPQASWQPDYVFPSFLQEMGFQIEQKNSQLKIQHPQKILFPIRRDLKNTPDLFPILAVLCALSQGTCRLDGVQHVRYKESNRLEGIACLLKHLQCFTEIHPDSMVIYGRGFKKAPFFKWDPRGDHRLAMAGAVLKQAGMDIKILNPLVVNKSFPEFWSVVKMHP